MAAFAVSAVFSSVAPEFLGVGLHRHSPALAGLLVFLLFLMSVSGQVLVPHLWNALAAGCGLLVAGVALLVLSLAGSLASLFARPVCAGIGFCAGAGVLVSLLGSRPPT